jgi:hypothetical protein
MNTTIRRLEKRIEKLLAALKDATEYVEDYGIGNDGKLTRQAEKAIRKARPILAEDAANSR